MLLMTRASVLALAMCASGGWAQTADPVSSTGAVGVPGDAAATSANDGIGDIIVTAQRRSEKLQKTALAVSAVDGAALRNAGVSQPQDLTKLIPALQLSPLGAGGTQVTIRGVGNFAPFLYSEPAVAINYDGVYLARSAAPNGLFFDLERVEVLKGPQGTLYGRNATGGAINIISVRPKLNRFGLNADLEIGNYGLQRGSAAINVPLGSKAALRVAGQFVDRSGYLSDGYLDDVGQAVRAQLLVAPSDALTVVLKADYVHQGGKGIAGVLVPNGFLVPGDPYRGPTSPESQAILRGASLGISGGTNPILIPPFDTDGFTDLESYGVSATIDYDIGFGTLTFLPAWRKTTNDFKHYAGGFPLISQESSDQTTLELRLASNAGSPFKWVVGGYYFDDRSKLFALANQGVSRTATTASSLPVKSLAAFAEVSVPIVETFRLTGGLRYTNEKKRQRGVNVSALPPVPPMLFPVVCPSPAIIDAAARTCTGAFVGELEFNRVTYKGGVEFDAGDRSLLFASIETGFKAGGFYPSLAPNTYAPEKVTAFTIGSKNRFADNTLQLNLEAFYWKYDDKQVSHLGPIRPAGNTIITENAGQARIYGVEADLIWQPTDADRLNVNLQYANSKYRKFTYTVPLLAATTLRAAVDCPQTINTNPFSGARTATVDCAGRPLPQTPRWTLNASYSHSFDLASGKLDAIIGTRLTSSYFSGEEFLAGQFQGDSMVSYASLTWRNAGDKFSLGAYVDNIEDRAVKSSSFVQPVVGVAVVALRAPRTFGVRAGVRF